MAFADVSDQDLVNKMAKIERELVGSRFKHSTNQLENTSHLRNLRRDIARIKSEARRREIAQGLAKDALLAKFRPESSGSAAAPSAAKGGFLQGIVDKISSND